MWEDLTTDKEEVPAEMENPGYQPNLEKSVITPNVDREITLLNKEVHIPMGYQLTSEQREKIMKVLTEENPTAIYQLMMEGAGGLMEGDPSLSEAQALEKIMKTDYGQILYRLYKSEAPATAPVAKGEQANVYTGPVGREIEQRKERLIEKSGGKLSDSEIYSKIFKADPKLYERYIREITVSTAVG